MKKHYYIEVSTIFDGYNFNQNAVIESTLTQDEIKMSIFQNPSDYIHSNTDEVVDYVEVTQITEAEYNVLNKFI